MGNYADLPARHRLVLMVARTVLTLRHPALVARFAMRLGYLPNPAAPSRYNELMLWRKIVDRNPLFVTLTDKLAAKAYIHAACPELPIPKTHGPAGTPKTSRRNCLPARSSSKPIMAAR